MTNGATRLILLALLVLPAACSGTPDPLRVEGIEFAEDELFRYLDISDTEPAQVYEVARQILRVHFAGGRVIEDPRNLRLEVPPRGFTGAPRQVQVFVQIGAVEGGTRVEIFCKVDELREDPLESPADPWRWVARDAELENVLFHEIWDEVVLRQQEGD